MDRLDNDFLGEIEHEQYILKKTYVHGQGRHLRLYHTRLTPKTDPTATLIIVHGFGQHSGRFIHIAENFVKQRYEVLLLDMRGFGYSGGPRGCSEVEDLQRDVIAIIKEANQALPLFLYGHSLGALVVLTLTYDYLHLNVSGVMLTSPLLGFPTDRRLPWVKRFLIKALGKKMEDFVANSMVNPTALTKSNKHIQTIFSDRLMIPFLSVRMGRSILVNVERVQQLAPHYTTPILIVHGKQDSVTNYHDSVDFIDRTSSKRKLLHLFENGYHELQHDEECDEMLRIGNKWFAELPTTPLGHVNLERRLRRRRGKMPWKWILLAVIYLVAVVRLARAAPRGARPSFVNLLLGPILYLLSDKKK